MNYDIHGRAVVQHFYTELEKIALSPATMARAALKRQAAVVDTKKLVGAKRFLPWTAEAKAVRAAKGKANQFSKKVDSSLLAKRKAALELSGSARNTDRARGAEMLKGLNETNAPTSGLQAARRRAGLGGGKLTPPEPKSGWMPPSRMAKGAILGTGVVAAGGTAAYAGNKYLNDPGYSGGY